MHSALDDCSVFLLTICIKSEAQIAVRKFYKSIQKSDSRAVWPKCRRKSSWKSYTSSLYLLTSRVLDYVLNGSFGYLILVRQAVVERNKATCGTNDLGLHIFCILCHFSPTAYPFKGQNPRFTDKRYC